MNPEDPLQMTSETAVRDRYSAASLEPEAALCCPTDYNPDLLKVIPQEILERDYGCGDPSRHVRAGETVLDLGSGGGKLCYIMAQVVGPRGRVIGVDCNPEMLALARRHQATVAERLGYANVEFRRGLIQDLGLDLDQLAEQLSQHPVASADDWLRLRAIEETLRKERPLLEDGSVDCVVSNCVLNLVRNSDRSLLFAEIFRVLKPGGRAVISDIVSDQEVPPELQQDAALWSGCLSGAFREDQFMEAFRLAGFHGMQILQRQRDPWREVQGICFRSLTVAAYKAPAAAHEPADRDLLYKGPFAEVRLDDGRLCLRGVRLSVPRQVALLLQQPPYQGLFEALDLQPGPFPILGTLDAVESQPPQTSPCCGGSSACC